MILFEEERENKIDLKIKTRSWTKGGMEVKRERGREQIRKKDRGYAERGREEWSERQRREVYKLSGPLLSALHHTAEQRGRKLKLQPASTNPVETDPYLTD